MDDFNREETPTMESNPSEGQSESPVSIVPGGLVLALSQVPPETPKAATPRQQSYHELPETPKQHTHQELPELIASQGGFQKVLEAQLADLHKRLLAAHARELECQVVRADTCGNRNGTCKSIEEVFKSADKEAWDLGEDIPPPTSDGSLRPMSEVSFRVSTNSCATTTQGETPKSAAAREMDKPHSEGTPKCAVAREMDKPHSEGDAAGMVGKYSSLRTNHDAVMRASLRGKASPDPSVNARPKKSAKKFHSQEGRAKPFSDIFSDFGFKKQRTFERQRTHPLEDTQNGHDHRTKPDQPQSAETSPRSRHSQITPDESCRRVSIIAGSARSSRASSRMSKISTVSERLSKVSRNSDMTLFGNMQTFASEDSKAGIVVEILPIWAENDRVVHKLSAARTRSCSQLRRHLNSSMSEWEDSFDENGDGSYDRWVQWCVNWFVVSPNSAKRLIWDLTSMFLLGLEVVTIPLTLLLVQDTPFMVTLGWVTRVFWTFDMVASFSTGFVKKNGNLEMHPARIARRYASTWLPLDILVVGVDWLQVFLSSMSSAGNTAQFGRTMRSMRILRMMRLARAAKGPQVLQAILEHIHSQRLPLAVSIGKTVVFIVCMVHVMACLWFWVGSLSNEGWVAVNGYEDKGKLHQYAASYHWSLTQFAGSMEIVPHTLAERVYSIFILLLAFLIATWVVSNLTSSMTQLHIISGKKNIAFAALRRYLIQHKISQGLITRVQLNAMHMFVEQQREIPEDDVELLTLVSEPLRVELHFEIGMHRLSVHPFFLRYAQENPSAMRRICHLGIDIAAFSKGDVLFNHADGPAEADEIYMMFVVSGSLSYWKYTPIDESAQEACLASAALMSMDSYGGPPSITASAENRLAIGHHASARTMSEAVEPGNFLCEGVLWVKQWPYCGTLRAMDECRVLMLDKETFCELSVKYQSPDFLLNPYAELYVQDVNAEARDCSDLGNAVDAVARVTKAYGDPPRHLATVAASRIPAVANASRSRISRAGGGR